MKYVKVPIAEFKEMIAKNALISGLEMRIHSMECREMTILDLKNEIKKINDEINRLKIIELKNNLNKES